MSDNTSNSPVITRYLEQLGGCKMLTKEETKVVAVRIKQTEAKILEKSLGYPLFRQQVLIICNQVARNHRNVPKYTRDLSDESPDKDVKRRAAEFAGVADVLLDGDPSPDVVSLLSFINDLKLTSSAITQMLEPIKENYRAMGRNRELTGNVYKFLEVSDDREYQELLRNCEDGAFRRQLAKRLFTDEATLLKKLRQQESVLKYNHQKELGSEEMRQTVELVEAVSAMQGTCGQDRENLIRGNLPLVVSRATKIFNTGMDLEDLIQEGNMGLIKAVDKFDPDKDVKLSTYATWWIDQAIRRGMANKARTVRVPIHVQENLRKIKRAYYVLSQKLGREPTQKEISKEVGIDEETLKTLQTSALHEVGIDSEAASGISYSDVLFDADQETPFRTASSKLLHEKLRNALSDLSERSEKIIRLRFGIGVRTDHTLEEVGQEFFITKERVRQLETKALTKLRTDAGLENEHREMEVEDD